MSTRVITTLIDDLDGSKADETVSFAVDGTSYAIDLTSANADAFRKAMERYVSAGRRLNRSPGRPAARTESSGPSNREIRVWAAENGVAVNSRGRISDAVVQQYLASR